MRANQSSGEDRRTGWLLWEKSPGYDVLPHEFYISMPELSGHHLARIYSLLRQNGRIHSAEKRDVETLIRTHLDKGDGISHHKSITLLDTELNFLATVLVKLLTRVVCGLSKSQRLCPSR